MLMASVFRVELNEIHLVNKAVFTEIMGHDLKYSGLQATDQDFFSSFHFQSYNIPV